MHVSVNFAIDTKINLVLVIVSTTIGHRLLFANFRLLHEFRRCSQIRPFIGIGSTDSEFCTTRHTARESAA